MYLDVFFIVNFIMDYLIIHITVKILDENSGIKRRVAAALLGALWSVFYVIALVKLEYSKVLLDVLGFAVVPAISCVMISGPKPRSVVRGMVALYMAGFCMAGVCYAIYNYTYAGYVINSGLPGKWQIILGVAAVFAINHIIAALLRARKRYGNSIYRVKLVINGKKVQFRGLVDTGNVLVDPYTGKCVHIVEYELLKGLLDKGDSNVKCRLVPFNSVGRMGGLLPVIDACSMEIYDKNMLICSDFNAAIGIYRGKLSQGGYYDALINAAILTNN